LGTKSKEKRAGSKEETLLFVTCYLLFELDDLI